MTENELAKIIVDIAFKLHVALGPGLLESVYLAVFAYELRKCGLKVETEKPIPVTYETVRLEIGFRADLVVEDKVIIELKSVDTISDVHKKQLLTYLKLTGIKLGLLINFGQDVLKGNVKRIVNGLDE
jgi:GxxExxY protein